MSDILQFPGAEPPRITPTREAPLMEPAMAPEIAVNELARITTIGSMVRLVFSFPGFCPDVEAPDGRHVVVKLLVPADALPAMYAALGEHLSPENNRP